MGVNGKGFKIHQNRLWLLLKTVHNAVENGTGIFATNPRKFLPQWNLPAEIEHFPQKKEVAEPEKAARFLFLRNQLDRRQSSSDLNSKLLIAWSNPKTNWIFDPRQVFRRDITDIETLLKYQLNSNLPIHPKLSLAQGYFANCRTLFEMYDSDPRNLVIYKTADEARGRIEKLHGFGRGLANLLMVQFLTRSIAQPTDPENIRPKIDVHKARVPINCGVISLNQDASHKYVTNGMLHTGAIARDLETAYVATVARHSVPLIEIEEAIWVLGSRCCTKRNYVHCKKNCPLADTLCIAMTPLSREVKGYYNIGNSKERRPDDRRELGQNTLNLDV